MTIAFRRWDIDHVIATGDWSLLVWGTWFRMMRQGELSKLARVQVDIPTELDNLWTLDIKKSTAVPPEVVRKNLEAIIERLADKILEATEAERIIYLWGDGSDETKVEITFTQRGSDAIVEVIESGWSQDDPAVVDRMIDNKGGWTLALVALKAWLENGVDTLGNSLYMGEII